MTNANLAVESESAVEVLPARRERLLSLDVFRGLTLIGMVLVNSPGDPHYKYGPLSHVAWHGWTFADLVFPFFLFMVGVSLPYSLESRLARGASRRELVAHALRRCLTLFAIGVCMNWYAKIDFADWHTAVDFAHLRFFNVLQRIGICSFVVTLMYLWWKPRAQAGFAAAVLVGYYVLLVFVPVPGSGAPCLEKIGNWAQFIDARVMGAHCGFSSNGQVFEGKGLLSTLPALVTTLLGVATGRYLRSATGVWEKLANLYFWGTAAMFLGAVWSLSFPINQILWTSSLVLFMGGMAMVILASCYLVADVRKIVWWTPPFVVFGVNSLAVWIASVTVKQTLEKIRWVGGDGKLIDLKTWCYHGLAGWCGPLNGSLAFALLFVTFWLAVMSVLYRRRIFFKV